MVASVDCRMINRIIVSAVRESELLYRKTKNAARLSQSFSVRTWLMALALNDVSTCVGRVDDEVFI